MTETLHNIFKIGTEYIHGVFAEASILFLLVGFVSLILGLVVLFFTMYIQFVGYRVTGKVIGALKEIRVKERSNKGQIEKKTKESYFAVLSISGRMEVYARKKPAKVEAM